MAEVRLVEVSKRFGSLPAVDRVSLDVPEGSFYTLLGPSGCGKTTTLRIVAGFYPPDRGDVFIGTTRVNDLPPYLRQTAMVFQEYALFPHMTVFENVAYGLRMRHVGSPDLARRVAAAAAPARRRRSPTIRPTGWWPISWGWPPSWRRRSQDRTRCGSAKSYCGCRWTDPASTRRREAWPADA